MAAVNALLVVGKGKIKEIREALEARGYYDKSRRISQTARDSFALPLTPSAVEELIVLQSSHDNGDLHTSLPAPFSNGDCCLVRADLPSSKRELASAATGHSMLQGALTQLLDRVDPTLSDRERTKLLSEVPQTWERHGDMAVLPPHSFHSPWWQDIGEELWTAVARALDCKRLARDSRILPDGYRSSGAEMLLGVDPWVTHVDNRVTYVFDITQIMFSSGNISEKLRIARFDCCSETVVDLFAGIGYFTLPYLVHARAKVVHACEWNPVAVEGLRRGLVANGVEERCVVHAGDCREVCPRGVADRVNLGLLPSSECGWATACAALRPDRGGWLHIHGNVCYKPGSGFTVRCNPWEELGKKKEEEERGKERRGEGGDTEKREDVKEEGLEDDDLETTRSSLKSRSLPFEPSKQPVHCCHDPDKVGQMSTLSHNSDHDPPTTLSSSLHASPSPDKGAAVVDSSISVAEDQSRSRLREKARWKWEERIMERVGELLEEGNPLSGGRCWRVWVRGVVKVKSYAPFVDHLVADVECRPVF